MIVVIKLFITVKDRNNSIVEDYLDYKTFDRNKVVIRLISNSAIMGPIIKTINVTYFQYFSSSTVFEHVKDN